MPRIIRDTLISVRDLAVAALPFVLLALVLLIAAYFLLKPMPPRRVVLATGPEQSAYAEFGKRYAAELKRYGIEVVLLPTRGSLDNLRALRDPKRDVDLGFVQGGSSEVARTVDEDKSGEPLESLGSLFLEPLWVFYRADAARALPGGMLTSIAQLPGWRINLGARGSGTPGLMRKLLEANGLERDRLTASFLELTPAVVALLDGKLDAMAFASAPESPMVQMLLQTPGIRLLEFPEAEAYARRFPFLSPVTLPQGIADLAHNVPAHDVPLIAATTSLVAREGTHPALEQLFVQAAAKIHSGAGWISRAGRFPTPQGTEFPLAAEAVRYYRTGPPLLQRYLPFWLANLIDRMWVALFTIIAALIPLSRVVPPLYQFRVRRRIFRWYRQLRSVEAQLAAASAPHADLIAELDRLDARAARITVPLSYADELYNLRSHIALVRARLR
ncbi:MAG TPA: TAXI family TRAP transporter solute-binding subunit [Burkholderiales bacterium]|nr:TAXI family TRAP transporter solute-binding subunit [Burkholderiales bacterium]